MATNNTPTTLGNLEFPQIKASLTEFLRNQSVFSGYNFEGSAIQTIIDLMAYNTFYYAYYANMINAEAFLDSAQKEDSMISLTKPLGYTVPARTAAKALVTVSGLATLPAIPEGSRFIATNENGIQYNFYNLEEIPAIDGVTPNSFYIYEAVRYVQFDALPNFDYTTQKINIAETNFDLSTLKVTITEKLADDSLYTSDWTLVQNIGYVSQVTENIYFVERTSTGFSILFGLNNSLGREIDSTITKINIRYITTSGSAGNNLITFRNGSVSGGNVIVSLISKSTGGRDKPDLDAIRNIAPKWFASQERAVTVNDYKALLIEAGFFENETQFNVFGGQDLNPPRYGRVFVSSYLSEDDARIAELIQYVKDRSVITVLPEYIVSDSLNVYTDFSFRLGSNVENNTTNRNIALSKVKSIFTQNFAKFGQYNVSFSASDFIQYLRDSGDPDVSFLTINADDFTNYVIENLSGGLEYTFNLGNEIDLPLAQRVELTNQFDVSDRIKQTTNFPEGYMGILRMYVTTNSQKNANVNLELWAIDPITSEEIQIPGNYGYFKTYAGVINIKNDVIAESATMTVNFKKKNFTIGFNNVVTFIYRNVSVLG